MLIIVLLCYHICECLVLGCLASVGPRGCSTSFACHSCFCLRSITRSVTSARSQSCGLSLYCMCASVCRHWRRSFPSSILRPAVTTIRAKLNCSKCTVSLRILHARMYARIITIHLHLLCQGKSHIPPRLRCAWTHSRPWAPRCRRDFHNEHVVLSC